MIDRSEHPYAAPAADLYVAPSQAPVFFPVGTTKLVAMSLCTLSLYQLYWFYKNFRAMKDHGQDLWPIPRTIFCALMAYTLFRAVRERGTDFAAGALAVAFFIISTLWRLPDPWWLLSMLSFLPILPVRKQIDAINEKAAPDADRNTRIRGWNYLAIVLGGLMLLLAHGSHVRADRGRVAESDRECGLKKNGPSRKVNPAD